MKKKLSTLVLSFILMVNMLINVFALNANAESNIDSIDLSFKPTHVIMNPTKNLLYASDKINKKVYEINLDTKEQRVLEFKYMPETLYFKNNTLFVCTLTIEHNSNNSAANTGLITLIDTSTFSVSKELTVGVTPSDIVVDDKNNIFVSSGSNQWTQIKSYSILTGNLISSSSSYMGYRLEMHPSNKKFYACDVNSSPRDIYRYDLNLGYISYGVDSPYHGDFPSHSDLDITPDGNLIFTNSGTIYSSTTDPKTDMQYFHQLESGYNDVAFNLPSNRFYIASQNGYIKAYSYDDFREIGTYNLSENINYLFHKDNNFIAVTKNYNDFYTIKILNEDILQPTDPNTQPPIVGTMTKPTFNPLTNEAYIIDRTFNTVNVFNCNKNTFTSKYKIPYSASNSCLSEDGTKLYIVNNDSKYLITELSLQDGSTRSLEYSSPLDDIFENYKRIYNKNNRLYVLTSEWAPKLLVFDATTFNQINFTVVSSSGNQTSLAEIGGLAFTSDNKYMISSRQYGWTAGNINNHLTKYEIIGNSFVEVSKSTTPIYRDPLDSSIVINEEKNNITYKDYVFNLSDLTQAEKVLTKPMIQMNKLQTVAATEDGVIYTKYNVFGEYPTDRLMKPAFFNNEGILYLYDNKNLQGIWPVSGDMNGDTEIDVLDLAEVASSYNSKYEDNAYKVIYDLNQDNIIDLYDLCTISKVLPSSSEARSYNLDTKNLTPIKF